MKLLFIDCCIRDSKESRTKQLCDYFLENLLRLHPEYEQETLVLKDEKFTPLLDEDIKERDFVMQSQDADHSMLRYARQFAKADRILIGAPYWDLSFPSILKVYIEHIFVNGITFGYDGPKAVGRCRADKLMYLQTAGGFIDEDEPGTVYLKAVCEMLGITEFQRICAQGMDILEIDWDIQWQEALEQAAAAAQNWK